jgi:hypothetical protein
MCVDPTSGDESASERSKPMVPTATVLAERLGPIRQALELPPAREFLTSAGFGGALALLAVLLLALLVVANSWRLAKRHREELEQRERHYEDARAERERAADLAVCEQRFKWVVETAGIEPAVSESATLGLGPELALELLSGLHRDAKRLDDETLVKAIGVYLNQFALVLAQQGGPLSHLRTERGDDIGDTSPTAASPRRAEPGPADAPPAQSATPESDVEAAASGTATGRRRRR